jgi:hypothetical protein
MTSIEAGEDDEDTTPSDAHNTPLEFKVQSLEITT